jgi:putative flippase GtrA
MIGKLKVLCLKYKEILLYLIFGGLTTVVSMLSFWLSYNVLGIHELIANVISWICAVTFAYFTNAKWVFESKAETGRERMREAVSFYTGRLATLGVEELIMLVFATLLGFNGLAVKFVAQVVVVILNYVISKLFVFKKAKT